MQAIQRKLQAEKAQIDQQKSQLRQRSINKLLQNEQTQLIVHYISNKLQSLSFSEISSYSAAEISKLIFEPQLKLLEQQFKLLPDQMCSLQEFVIVMLKVMRFDIEVCPQAAIGLREMFAIVGAGAKLIDYHSLFRYIVGQVVSAKEQISNTEFQMRFRENKLQDFLFHDKGIKRVFYSKELKVTICLDRVSNQLKIYDKDMKLAARFIPNKDKHEARNPQLVDMGFCQIYSRVGIVMDDSTLAVINLKAILNPDFEQTNAFTNEFTLKTVHPMKSIYFLEMLSKWISVSDDDQVFIYDLEKQRPEERCQQLNLGVSDLRVSDIIELTMLNMVAVISGNQIIFFNENLSQKHYIFSHGCNIRALRFSEQQNKFYVSGKENSITVFERDKILNDFKIKTLDLGKFKVNSFEVFPEMNVIVMIDDDCNVRLYDYHKKVVNQQQNFKQIKKNQQQLMLSKFNKHEFCLFETYMLVLCIDKVAIQSEAETRFNPYYFYNQTRELFYCSVNSQVVSLHMLSGEIEDAFTEDNSNIGKSMCFFLGNKTHIFEISDTGYMFELYFNDEKLQGENRNYKRKVNLEKILGAIYEEQTRAIMVWSDTKIIQLKNQGSNNFSLLNSIEFLNGEKIRDVQYNNGLITVFCVSTMILDFNCYSTKLMGNRMFRPTNLHLQASEEDTQILQYIRLDLQKLELLLCTNNIIFLIGQGKIGCLKVQDLLPKSKATYNFTKMKYQKISIKRRIKKAESTIDLDDDEKDKFIEDIIKTLFIFDTSGHMVSMDITQILKQFDSDERQEIMQIINEQSRLGFAKGGTVLDSPIKPQVKMITKSNLTDLGKPKSIKVWKAHDKEVIQIVGIDFQQPCLITYANDGYLKLWNDKCEMLFALKMPSFNRELWRMEEIEKQKCSANIDKMRGLLKDYHRRIRKSKQGQSPQHLIHKTKNFKRDNLFDKSNFIEPFVVQVQNRLVEDLMNKTQMPPRRFSLTQKKSKRQMSSGSQKSPEISPWKKNHKFVQLLEVVDRKHRSEKCPVELNKLRASLDVRKPTQQSPEKTMRIPFLPQLDHYIPEPKITEQVQESQAFDLYGDTEEGLETCMYLRNRRLGPRINKFDEIDKEFERKRMQQFKNTKKNAVIKVTKKEEQRMERDTKKEMKGELMENIKKIFEDHNQQVMRTKVGRLLEVPKVQIRKVEDNY